MPRILLVDDEENIRKVLKGLLVKRGYNDVLLAENGRKALDIIKAGGVDLVITDVMMRGMDGLTLFQLAKNDGPVFILLSAFTAGQTAQDALKDGVFGVVMKPYEEQELLDMVSAAIKEKQARGGAGQYGSAVQA